MAKPIEPTPILRGEDAKRFDEVLAQEERKPNKKRIDFIKESIEVFKKVAGK